MPSQILSLLSASDPSGATHRPEWFLTAARFQGLLVKKQKTCSVG